MMAVTIIVQLMQATVVRMSQKVTGKSAQHKHAAYHPEQHRQQGVASVYAMSTSEDLPKHKISVSNMSE